MHNDVVGMLFLHDSDPAEIPWQGTVETGSNLNTDILHGILSIIHSDADHYEVKRARIDVALLRTRNQVAHGQLVDVELEDYDAIHTDVLELLERFRTDVQNAAAARHYLRATPHAATWPSKPPSDEST
jgi:hypothetical protein